MGFTAVARKLPMILARVRETADAAVMAAPDILVIIDSPDFTHRVARQVRARAPAIPIVDYVAPTVWAWRSGRARAMRRYIDHVLALLPFEPEAYRRLGGPPCTYIGHTLIEQIGSLRPDGDEQRRRDGQAAGAAGAAGKPPQRNQAPHGGVRRDAAPAAGAGCGFRAGAADHAASARCGSRGRRELAGAAAHRGRRAGKESRIPDRARGLRQIRHRDIRTCARRRADDRRLPRRSRSRCGSRWRSPKPRRSFSQIW